MSQSLTCLPRAAGCFLCTELCGWLYGTIIKALKKTTSVNKRCLGLFCIHMQTKEFFFAKLTDWTGGCVFIRTKEINHRLERSSN